MQTSANYGTTGAKRQTFRRESPREILARIVEKHPGATEGRLLGLFEREIDGNRSVLAVIVEYWFTNNLRALMASKVQDTAPIIPKPEAVAKTEAETARVRERVKAAIQREAAITLLSMTLPHGKPLGESTGNECQALGRKVGGWLSEVARRVQPGQKVGDALSETDFQAIFRNAKA
jgi:hypothetical protein